MMQKILILDSHDSFTYNIAHMLETLSFEIQIEIEEGGVRDAASILAAGYLFVIIGPGPRSPQDLPELIVQVKALIAKVPILGICLGHQLLAQIYGAQIIYADAPTHGKQVLIEHSGQGLFAGINTPMQVMRYNSLIAAQIKAPLKVTAVDKHQQAMALKHCTEKIWAVQFHPESIGTPDGKLLLKNMVKLALLS